MEKNSKKLQSYEVEFIPIERRMCERRNPIAQLQREPYLGVDRRASAGRRPDDSAYALRLI
ncbi:MAG: hypothetical protein ACYCZH_12540 [Sulfuriferula sp.]